MMHRPQFNLKTMFWLTLVVAAFFGGMAVQKQFDKSSEVFSRVRVTGGATGTRAEWLELRDGSEWMRVQKE